MDHDYARDEAYCDYARHISERNKVNKTPIRTKPKEKVYWELANGKKIDIDEMTLEHLKNVLKLIVTRDLLKPKP